MRAVIAGDEPVSRRALALLLHTKLGIVTVGEARDLGKLLTLVKNNQPDLIILDAGLLIAKIDQLIQALHEQNFNPSVVVISERKENEEMALAAGADRFVSKGDHPNALLLAVTAELTTADHEHHTGR